MTRRRFPRSAPPLPKRTADTLRAAQDRLTIATMLAAGATETPIGPETWLRLPTGGSARFPSPLVEEVKRNRARAASREAGGPSRDQGATPLADSPENPPTGLPGGRCNSEANST
jgi:hypothetical protein